MKRCRKALVFLAAVLGMQGSIAMAQAHSPGPPAAGAPLPAVAGALRVDRNVEYARIGGRSLTLDVYRPPVRKTDAPNKTTPVVVWIHGAGPVGGDKFPTPAVDLVGHGYAVVSVDYRPAADAPFPAQLYDLKAAIRWVRANAVAYGLDAEHVGAWGISEGAQLAALLGVTGDVPALEGTEGAAGLSSRIQAVVDFYGPVDPTRAGKLRSDASQAGSPVGYITPDDAPFLIVHGTADTLVSPRQSERLQIALKQGGVENDLEYVVGAGHDVGQVMTPTVAEAVVRFFDQHLRGAPRQQEDNPGVSVQADAWEDPVMADGAGATRYKLYPTPASRGPNTQASYRIYYPPGYDLPANAKRRYPVIYYLHGKDNDSRAAVRDGYIGRADVAMRTGVMPPAIIVLVQGLSTSGYFDSVDGRYPLESEIIRDLIPHIDKTYRTIATRDARALEGHSMGGNGALRLAFKYPELFGSVASFSAALNPISESGGSKDRLNAMFDGDATRAEAQEAWTQATRNAERIRGRMNVRMIVGDKDNLMARNQWFSALLTRLKIDHSFTLSKGAPHAVKEVMARLETNPFAYYGKVFARYR